jgi:hypothetical protein
VLLHLAATEIGHGHLKRHIRDAAVTFRPNFVAETQRESLHAQR